MFYIFPSFMNIHQRNGIFLGPLEDNANDNQMVIKPSLLAQKG
jgi:hypothetical protein